MHAFHLPFTGVFLGGFSVLVIGMLAHFERHPFKQIIKATLIVMAVKASVNPMTSPMAYIAVGFQGLCGAAIFSLPFRNLLMSMGFAMLAMLESAFQKLLILTIFVGKEWLAALDIFYNSVCKTFGFNQDYPFSMLVVILYLSIYCLWGLLLGIWIHKLPGQIAVRRTLYQDLTPAAEAVSAPKKKGKGKILILILLICFVGFYTFFMLSKGQGSDLTFIVLRTLIIVLVWFYIFLPIWKQYIQRKLTEMKHEEMPDVLSFIPVISAYVKPLYNAVSKEFKGLRKWKEFVLGLIVISLRTDENQ